MNNPYQMKKHHVELLEKNRTYLLHNIRPTEEIWALFLEKGLFPSIMLEEIRSKDTKSLQVSSLLDALPYRGPDAFDLFVDTMLEGDHQFVAEYLITLEGTDQFREDIKRYCTDTVDTKLERIVDVYKKSVPKIQRFLERKFDVDLRDQDDAFCEKEQEVAELVERSELFEKEKRQIGEFFEQLTMKWERVANEVKRDYMSRSFLREEKKMLENLPEILSGSDYVHHGEKLNVSMSVIIDCLDKISTMLRSNRPTTARDELCKSQFGQDKTPVTKKVKQLRNQMTGLIEAIAVQPTICIDDVREPLDEMMRKLNNVLQDLFYVRGVFISMQQQKEELKDETLSLIHNFREIQRLEKEVIEKKKHMTELRQHGQTVNKKSRNHQRQLEQTKRALEEQKEAIGCLDDKMKRHIKSADQRIQFILKILPDENDIPGLPTCGRCTSMSRVCLNDGSEAEDEATRLLQSRESTCNLEDAPLELGTSDADKPQAKNNTQRKGGKPPSKGKPKSIVHQQQTKANQNFKYNTKPPKSNTHPVNNLKNEIKNYKNVQTVQTCVDDSGSQIRNKTNMINSDCQDLKVVKDPPKSPSTNITDEVESACSVNVEREYYKDASGVCINQKATPEQHLSGNIPIVVRDKESSPNMNRKSTIKNCSSAGEKSKGLDGNYKHQNGLDSGNNNSGIIINSNSSIACEKLKSLDGNYEHHNCLDSGNTNSGIIINSNSAPKSNLSKGPISDSKTNATIKRRESQDNTLRKMRDAITKTLKRDDSDQPLKSHSISKARIKSNPSNKKNRKGVVNGVVNDAIRSLEFAQSRYSSKSNLSNSSMNSEDFLVTSRENRRPSVINGSDMLKTILPEVPSSSNSSLTSEEDPSVNASFTTARKPSEAKQPQNLTLDGSAAPKVLQKNTPRTQWVNSFEQPQRKLLAANKIKL